MYDLIDSDYIITTQLILVLHYQPSLVVSVTASHKSGPGSNPTAEKKKKPLIVEF